MPEFTDAGERTIIAHRSGANSGCFAKAHRIHSCDTSRSQVFPNRIAAILRQRMRSSLARGCRRQVTGRIVDQQIADMLFGAAVVECAPLRVGNLYPVHGGGHLAALGHQIPTFLIDAALAVPRQAGAR